MSAMVTVGSRRIGDGQPCFIVAEIGLNHNGEIELAKRLIDAAHLAGCDAVKFQKRTPELCVPPEQRDVQRETPWGVMTYFEYRLRIEFGKAEYDEIERYCRERGIMWFVSCWDEGAVDFMRDYDVPLFKIASASVTDHQLIRLTSETGRVIALSTGMSTMDEIRSAVSLLEPGRFLLTHCTSTYPCQPHELNLRVIQTLRSEFNCPIGYSGHEVGLQTTYAAVALGACFIERHITLDRTMWGSDQAASVEPSGFMRLVRDVRTIERAMGDGVKRVYDSELPVMKRLRRTAAGAR